MQLTQHHSVYSSSGTKLNENLKKGEKERDPKDEGTKNDTDSTVCNVVGLDD